MSDELQKELKIIEDETDECLACKKHRPYQRYCDQHRSLLNNIYDKLKNLKELNNMTKLEPGTHIFSETELYVNDNMFNLGNIFKMEKEKDGTIIFTENCDEWHSLITTRDEAIMILVRGLNFLTKHNNT